MESFCPGVPTLQALLSGATVLQRTLGRLGHDYDGFRLLIPPKLGQTIEHEMQRADPAEWLPYTDGIVIHAEGTLKQLVLCESMWIGWKTGRRRKRKPRYAISA